MPDAKRKKLRGTWHGVKFEADAGVPRGEVVLLCQQFASIVRGKMLRGDVTLTFPPGLPQRKPKEPSDAPA